jgi:hypothetical protein
MSLSALKDHLINYHGCGNTEITTREGYSLIEHHEYGHHPKGVTIDHDHIGMKYRN